MTELPTAGAMRQLGYGINDNGQKSAVTSTTATLSFTRTVSRVT